MGRSPAMHRDQIVRNPEWSSLGLLQICKKTINQYNENPSSKSQLCSTRRINKPPQISTDQTPGPPKTTDKRFLKTGHPPSNKKCHSTSVKEIMLHYPTNCPSHAFNEHDPPATPPSSASASLLISSPASPHERNNIPTNGSPKISSLLL